MIEDHSSCIRVSDTGICKNCYSKKIIKNGTTKTKKQQYICKSCNKRFIEFYSYKAYKKNINSQIIQLTNEGMGIRSTARVLNISTTTLLRRIIKIADDISQPKISFYQSYELDEMRFFIRKKSNLVGLCY
ncbi:IS1-like element transposase [Chryseobacterium aahli]|uniref:IS1/IS1595 family N-terminal zinc-binding domain-containing protein n=1 Tax=Chryseobacterium aahli TaxID=1278643 RepID=UPI001F60B9DC|nr:IS1-like element transposase [Chryseobacterium aahli]MCI3937849.1 IS1-like element transposase [Chryseobacterium aahli]